MPASDLFNTFVESDRMRQRCRRSPGSLPFTAKHAAETVALKPLHQKFFSGTEKARLSMKVYTRTGDAGQTSLFNGTRVRKHNSRVEAYGTVDECNSSVGLACSFLRVKLDSGEASAGDASEIEKLMSRLMTVQNRLFDLGAHLATPRDTSSPEKLAKTAFPSSATDELESWIDDMECALQPLTTFILPGGHPSSAALHVARTVARRAERAVTPMLTASTEDREDCQDSDSAADETIDPAAYRFLNRLSDFFFVASRQANKLTETADVTWSKANENA